MMTRSGQSCVTPIFGAILLLLAALPAKAQSEKSYTGARACSACHQSAYQQWSHSWHGKFLQSAGARTIEGNFAPGKVTLRGSTYVLQRRSGRYYVSESYLAGKLWDHEVDYTLGGRRVQQYLSTLRDGRILVLPVSWDNIRKKWMHNLDVENAEEGGDPAPVWNKSCFSCHVTAGQKNYDLSQDSYHTTWKDPGVGCESCHGPGSEHVAEAKNAAAAPAEDGSRASGKKAAIDATIVNLAKLDPTRSTMACAQCHSLRDVYAGGFEPGRNYYDFFLPLMEYRLPAAKDPAYWPDGRPRQLANEAIAFWQSECFLKGRATCLTCHSRPHDMGVAQNPQLRASSNALCIQCHAAIGRDVSAHTHHPVSSTGSSCIECHMPRSVTSLHARMRDHSIGDPVPENTVRHGIPNACNLCHTAKTAEWAAQKVKAWYGAKTGQKWIVRADAFSKGRTADPAAVPALLKVLADSSEGPWIHANAAGYLGNFPEDPAAYAAVLRSLTDAQPLVRATAAAAIRPRAAQRAAVAPQLAAMLGDPVTTVKMSAAIGLVAMGVRRIPGEAGERFEHAKQLYHARAEIDSDDAQQQLAAGKFFFLAGDPDDAIAAFRAASKLDPSLAVQVYLAQSLIAKGDLQPAKEILKSIPPADPQYDAAQRLLAQAEVSGQPRGGSGQTTAGAPAQGNSAAQTAFLDGQLMYRNKNCVNALPRLEEALRLDPQASWTTQAQIDRAICLEKLGRMSEAEVAIKALSENETAARDVDLQLAFTELLYQTGRAEEALKVVNDLVAAVPNASMPYFWQAKVLLRLHRVDEAARAAEQSMRLDPDAPAAHNLLIGIYQMQGRTKEAAEQAAWLRNYERRIE